MGAGQIGGIATLLDMDFNNAAGFLGKPATSVDGQYVVYYLSTAMLFCAGALIEPHIVLTPAVCVYGEDYKFAVYGGAHRFLENAGAKRYVENVCIHRAYNHTERCVTDNVALLVLNKQFGFRQREANTEYILNRVRYGVSYDGLLEKNDNPKCSYYGWGSRRNGFLLPLLIDKRRVDVKVLDSSKCDEIWDTDGKYLCLDQPFCVDDLGSVVVCDGYVQGMMTSRLIDRPCSVGFLNIALYTKFLECAVDDSRDVNDNYMVEQKATLPDVKQVTVETSSNSMF